MDTSQPRPCYWAVLPAGIRYDHELPPNAKLLYAELSALSNTSGYCYASNNYFAQLYGVDLRTIQRLLGLLQKKGYISTIVLRNERNNAVVGRKIYCGLNPLADAKRDAQSVPPPDKNVVTPPDKNVTHNNIYINNIPPITPQIGGTKKQRQKSVATWKPERFDGFWKFYPKKAGKAAAVKAWDRLKPSDALIAEIGIKLSILVKSTAWQDKKYIPHASTFLNGERWNDVEDLDKSDLDRPGISSTASGWAEDPEVI